MTRESDREARTDAVRALEGEFSDLLTRIRRILSENAQRVHPDMLPGAYKVFTTIVRHEGLTASAVAEMLDADKGQISRTIRDLEQWDLVVRTPDPADKRSSLLSATPSGLQRLEEVRRPQENVLMTVLDAWPIDEINSLTRLLHALVAGTVPVQP